jgi:hypothetical protein
LTNMENSTRLLFDTCTVFFLPKYIPFVSCKIQLHGHVVSLCLLVSIPIVQSAFSMFVLFLLAEMSQELICWFYVRVFVYRGASTLNDYQVCFRVVCFILGTGVLCLKMYVSMFPLMRSSWFLM